MKAQPCKLIVGEDYVPCDAGECTHVKLNIPGPTGEIWLPVILKGTRDGTHCWSWNGDTEKPTLKPSVLTRCGDLWRCHSFINDGQAKFLDDCTHDLAGKTVDLDDV